LIGTSSQPHRRAPLLFLVMLARYRRVGVGPADIRRRRVGVAGARQGGIAKAIAASSRRRSLALRQGVKAAAQSAVIHDVTGGNTRVDPPRRVLRCQKMLRRRSPRRQKSKAFSCSLSRIGSGLEGPRVTRPSRPAFELVEGSEERLAGNHVA